MKLKPCPFCGEDTLAEDGSLEIKYNKNIPVLGMDEYYVCCGICNSRGSTGYSEWQAIALWNTRHE